MVSRRHTWHHFVEWWVKCYSHGADDETPSVASRHRYDGGKESIQAHIDPYSGAMREFFWVSLMRQYTSSDRNAQAVTYQ